jgi:tRNA(fMet)-specific endonuclease VapC
MGLILDTSILIADERGKFDMPGFLEHCGEAQPIIAAITASELLHGVERASDPVRKERRLRHVEQVLAAVRIQSFDLAQARVHARIWADLAARGMIIGPYDLQIAAAALALGQSLATLNVHEFARVDGLKIIDSTPFQIR